MRKMMVYFVGSGSEWAAVTVERKLRFFKGMENV